MAIVIISTVRSTSTRCRPVCTPPSGASRSSRARSRPRYIGFDLLVWEGAPVWGGRLWSGLRARAGRSQIRALAVHGDVRRPEAGWRGSSPRPRRGRRKAAGRRVPPRSRAASSRSRSTRPPTASCGVALEVRGKDIATLCSASTATRRSRLRRLGGGRRRRGRGRGACAAAARGRSRPALRSRTAGDGRARGGGRPAGARGRGALRQGAGKPLPPRHEVAPLAARKIRRTARGASCGPEDAGQGRARLGWRHILQLVVAAAVRTSDDQVRSRGHRLASGVTQGSEDRQSPGVISPCFSATSRSPGDALVSTTETAPQATRGRVASATRAIRSAPHPSHRVAGLLDPGAIVAW